MDSRSYSRKRGHSPRSDRYKDREDERSRNVRDGYRDTRDYRRGSEREVSEKQHALIKSDVEVKSPPGFPEGYPWRRGDWLCPSPGCEGYVTTPKNRNCIQCGRAQPHFMILTELAKNDKFRTEMCCLPACDMRGCCCAHSLCELREYAKSREWQKVPESQSPPACAPAPTAEESSALIKRWHIKELGVTVLGRLPGPLSDVIHRSFFVPTDVKDTTTYLLKSLADIIRPQTYVISTPPGLNELLSTLLKRNLVTTGIACSSDGVLAIALDKEVLLVRTKDFSAEDLGLLAFALSFSGMTVVHSDEDKCYLRASFPKIYTDMFDRVRVVDNPSEIIYVAADTQEAATDRATQARLDSMNPTPLLPTPTDSTA